MRILVLNNVAASGPTAPLATYTNALRRAGAVTVVRSCGPKARLEDLLADARTFDRVVAAGGDGTVSSTAYALRHSDIPLLAYPGGTANLLAANLGIPSAPAKLARLTMEAPTIYADLGELTATPWGLDPQDAIDDSDRRRVRRRTAGFAIMAGCGFDARIMRDAQALKQQFGVAAYYVSAMQNLLPREATFTIELDDETLTRTGIAVLIVNFAKIQFDISLAHDSDPTDGFLEVVVLGTHNAIELLPALIAALIDRITPTPLPGIEVLRARTVRIVADPSLPLQYDGEILPGSTPFTARVLPGAARFIVPRP